MSIRFASLSDESVMAAVALGETAAMDELIARFGRRVHGVALAIVRDAATAEEVSQDAFVRAWRFAQSYDVRRGTVLSWLLRIAHNLAVDTLRVTRAQPTDPATFTERAGPIDDIDRIAMQEEVRDLLASLPDEQRRALVLAAFYGRTALEVSELEGIPLGTAKTRIRLGLEKIRSGLNPVRPDQEQR